jgi:hypothetical protein
MITFTITPAGIPSILTREKVCPNQMRKIMYPSKPKIIHNMGKLHPGQVRKYMNPSVLFLSK